MSLKGWFDHLENFRHALAHRIPLYIPPYIVLDSKLPQHQELEVAMMQAKMDGDMAAYDLLSDEQKKLAVFNPIMTHSFEEEARRVVFHAQLLADFNTVEEVGHRILAELNR